MAEVRGTTVGILVRIGTGEPVEVAEVEVPLRIAFNRQELNYGGGRVETEAYISADFDKLNNDIRAALIGVAEELPVLEPFGEEHERIGSDD